MAKCRECGYGSRMGTFRIAFFGAVLAASGMGWACSSPDDNDAVKVDAVAPVGTSAPDSGGDASDASSSSVDAADSGSMNLDATPDGWCGPQSILEKPSSPGVTWAEGPACSRGLCDGVDSRVYTITSNPMGDRASLRPDRNLGCVAVPGELGSRCCPRGCYAHAIGACSSGGFSVLYRCPIVADAGLRLAPATNCRSEPTGELGPPTFDAYCCDDSKPY